MVRRIPSWLLSEAERQRQEQDTPSRRLDEAPSPPHRHAARLCAVCRRVYVQRGSEVVCGVCGGS
jgi:hypothetical protein